MYEPCLCGATDCRRCHPSTWWQEEAADRVDARRAEAFDRLGPDRTGRHLPSVSDWLATALRWARGLADADPQDLADGLDDEDKEAIGELALRLDEVVTKLGEATPATIDDFAPGERVEL